MGHQDMDEDDGLGVAFICDDQEQPVRARILTGLVEVYIAFAEELEDATENGYRVGAGDHWDRCPTLPRDNDGHTRCVSSHGSGMFHRVDLSSDVDDDEVFGLSLRSIHAPIAPRPLPLEDD